MPCSIALGSKAVIAPGALGDVAVLDHKAVGPAW